MPARSSYLSAQQSSVDEELERLVRATLREHATPENTSLAKEWIHRLLPEHRFPHTAAAEVGRSVAALLEKLRAHSRIEAADYLEDRHAAFMRCRLSRRHTLDAQPAVLQTLLLLARQPTRVPLRTVRSLRDVAEARKARVAERCREDFESAHACQALLEAELRGAAEDESAEWEAAWAEPDQVPEDGPSVEELAAGPGTVVPRPAAVLQLPSSARPAAAPPPGSPSSSGSPRSSSSSSSAGAPLAPAPPRGARPPPLPLLQPPGHDASARGDVGLEGPLPAKGSGAPRWAPAWPLPQARPPGSAPAADLPRGALPAPPWVSPPAAAGGKAVLAAAASEQAVVEAALQMLAGRVGGLVSSAADDGSLAWLPATPGHLSSGALAGSLRRLTELGSALCRLRSLTAVLQASAPPLADAQLCRELAWEVAEGRLSLALVALRGGLGTGPRAKPMVAGAAEEAPVIFGLCWHSLGEALGQLLTELAAEAQALQAGLYHTELAAESAKHLEAPLTLLQVEKWVEPRRRPVVGVHGVLDGALQGVAARCQGQDPREWPELASEELLTHLARALRSDSLCGGASQWMARLWRGAMRPVLEAMDLWSRTGKIHDPCGEFRGACDLSAGAGAVPALLPQGVFAAGRLASLLRDWAPLPDQAVQEGCIDAAAGFFDLCKSLPGDAARHRHRQFVPLEAAVQAAVLRPALVGSREAERPLLLRVLLDEDRGLLSHLAAVRLVCFLGRGAAVAPLVRLLLRHTRTGGRASATGPSVVELGTALADGLEPGRDGCPAKAAQRLCLQHLSLVRGDPAGGGSSAGATRDPCEWLNSLWARYAAPSPLGRVLGEEALRVYSCVMALLLRVRLAQEALLEVQRLPLLGFHGRRSRQARERGEDSVQLAGLAHSADLLRAELSHFAGCLDRYLRVEVIQKSCRAFDAELRRLACRDFDSVGEPGAGPVDAVELMARLHGEHLRRLQQHCFLAPETQAVLADVEYLLGLAFELRGTLAGLLPGAEDPEGVDDLATESPMALDDRFAAFAGLSAAALKVASVRQELQSSLKYLLQVLRVSIAQGPRHPALSLCLHINFNGFYYSEGT